MNAAQRHEDFADVPSRVAAILKHAGLISARGRWKHDYSDGAREALRACLSTAEWICGISRKSDPIIIDPLDLVGACIEDLISELRKMQGALTAS
ncbi:MAG: hypothetical protein A3H32_14455 [Betaproteobacteria bacterium RIFCSPLOWO2_02_FULL_63_19]|nr:MAG: hypothetical protein A3H32_14455 [Betaproteobacteria bacterium RIFCSPLOWO2_02_FULL_63_19]